MTEEIKEQLEALEREYEESLRWFALTLKCMRLLAALGSYWNGIVVASALLTQDWWLSTTQSIPFLGCMAAWWWTARRLKRLDLDEGSDR